MPDEPSEAQAAPEAGSQNSGLFPHTQWSAISQARGKEGHDGIRRLASQYWRPLYLYLRRRGRTHDDAADDVQGFFEFVLSSGFFEHVEREGGKFRSYLLRSLDRWRSRQRVRDGAQKRGGGSVHVPMDETQELEELADAHDGISPEAAYDRQWAAEMVSRSVASISEDYTRRGRDQWFAALSPSLPGGTGLPAYTELAARLGASEAAVKKAVFDLRQAFGAQLRKEIRATVRTNEDAEEELRHLVSVMSAS